MGKKPINYVKPFNNHAVAHVLYYSSNSLINKSFAVKLTVLIPFQIIKLLILLVSDSSQSNKLLIAITTQDKTYSGFFCTS